MNVKATGIAAGFALTLSFLTGIICGNAIGTVIIRSLIFCLIFAAGAAGINFLYQKFLAENTGTSFSSPSSVSQNRTGGNVDIVITDDNLDEDDSAPKFFVENNRQGLSQNTVQTHSPPPVQNADGTEDVSESNVKSEPVTPQSLPQQEEADESFSSSKQETVDQNAQIQAEKPASFVSAPLESVTRVAQDVPSNAGDAANKVNSYADGANIENIDALPDIGELNENGKNEGVSDIINDSDFATKGSSSSGSTSFPNGTEASAANADVMAQAIRTLLKKDE